MHDGLGVENAEWIYPFREETTVQIHFEILQLKQLRTLTIEDNTLVQHNSGLERVLDYNYNPSKERLNIITCSMDKAADTNRSILTQSARGFDPLSFYVSITVESELILRSLWKLQLNISIGFPSRSVIQIK